MSVMTVLTNVKWTLSYSSKLFYIQSRQIGNGTYHEETRELKKWRREISPEY